MARARRRPDNRGLLDQAAALSRVQENLTAWGGAPTNVTLAGHSSGASAVLCPAAMRRPRAVPSCADDPLAMIHAYAPTIFQVVEDEEALLTDPLTALGSGEARGFELPVGQAAEEKRCGSPPGRRLRRDAAGRPGSRPGAWRPSATRSSEHHPARRTARARRRPRVCHRRDLPARRPRAGLFKTLREHHPEFVLLGGTLAECDRVGDSGADYSAKHHRHGVNVQVVTNPAGEVLWIPFALPGRTHDLTAARTHRMIRICERQDVPKLADRTYQGADSRVTTGLKRLPHGELTLTPGTQSTGPRQRQGRRSKAAWLS